MQALDTKVREYARGYIAKFRDRGECEFMGEFAFKFPIAVFVELMGLPHEDVDQLLIWEHGLLHEPDFDKIVQATRSVHDYLVKKLEERRRNPQDDFLSIVTTAKIDGRLLTLDEQIGISFNLYTGGLDTVSTNIDFTLGTWPRIRTTRRICGSIPSRFRSRQRSCCEPTRRCRRSGFA